MKEHTKPKNREHGLLKFRNHLLSRVSTSMSFEILLCWFVVSYLIAMDAYLDMSTADMTRQGLSQYVEKVEHARVQRIPVSDTHPNPNNIV